MTNHVVKSIAKPGNDWNSNNPHTTTIFICEEASLKFHVPGKDKIDQSYCAEKSGFQTSVAMI